MRFATGVDEDLRPFYDRFRDDPVIGRAVRARPELRVRRKPVPWEALAAAITEQLIEFERAVAIQRRSPRSRRRGSPRSTWRRSGRWRCGAPRARWRAGARTSTRPRASPAPAT